MQNYEGLIQALDALEAGLRQCGLWAEMPPAPSALDSRLPFCCDTMSLQEWLQWLLLPRLRALVEAQGVLPARSNIVPYAEMVWPVEPPYDVLVALLRNVDDVFQATG